MMNRVEAHKILNRVRDCRQMPSDAQIANALRALGDMGDVADYPVVTRRKVGTWELRNRGLKPAVWCEVIA